MASRVARTACLAAAAARAAAGAALAWSRGGEGELAVCGGLDTSCAGAPACSQFAVGPCGGSPTSAPPFYLQGQVEGLAFVYGGDSEYLTDMSLLTEQLPLEVADATYRSMQVDGEGEAARHASLRTGAFYGDDPDMFRGFLGMASYLLQEGTAASAAVPVTAPAAPGPDFVNTVSVCVGPRLPDTGACGTAVTPTGGEFKLSIYGHVAGGWYEDAEDVEGVAYLGVRTKLSINEAAAGVRVSLNGGSGTLATISDEDVTEMLISEVHGSGRQLLFKFPPTANVGTLDTLDAPDATKNVKVKVSKAGPSSVYVDYLFAARDFSEDRTYFVYGPTVTEKQAAPPAPRPTFLV